ncbi:MAG: hypothetical protein KC619_18930 [Myxococcales bacterium]|nr:hypothetical protein [Myxococcales bacterium]
MRVARVGWVLLVGACGGVTSVAAPPTPPVETEHAEAPLVEDAWFGLPPMTPAAWAPEAEPGWTWVTLPTLPTGTETQNPGLGDEAMTALRPRRSRGLVIEAGYMPFGMCGNDVEGLLGVEEHEALNAELHGTVIPPAEVAELRRLGAWFADYFVSKGMDPGRIRVVLQADLIEGDVPAASRFRPVMRLRVLVPTPTES